MQETVTVTSLQSKAVAKRKSKAGLAAMAKSKPMAKKLAALRQREHERRVRITAEIDVWFKRFDTNGDGMLQRDELRELLTWLHPSRPPTDANLDLIIEKATAIESYSMRIAGDPNGALSWHDVRPAVLQYNDYVKDQQYIDTVFERYDTDRSGELDASELLHLLQRIAPEELEVDESDVEYILQQFDSNSDGVIDRNELLPLLAKWSHIAFEKVEEARHAKSTAIQKQWGLVKAEAAQVGGAIKTGGEKVLSIVQLARQAKEKQKQVQTKWRFAAEGAAGQSGAPLGGSGKGGLLKVVEAARRQRQLEAAEAEAAAGGAPALNSSPPAAAAPPSTSVLAAAGAAAAAAASGPAPSSPRRSIPSPRSLRTTPRAASQAAGVRVAAPEAEGSSGSTRLELQHSRAESFSRGAVAAQDRDRAWQASDRVVARRMSAAVQRENTRMLQLREDSCGDSSTAKASSKASPKDRSRRRGDDRASSSMCVIS